MTQRKRLIELIHEFGFSGYEINDLADYLLDNGVVVVPCRCCECRYWVEDDDIGYCDNPDGLDNYAHPTDFCPYGERKGGDE